VTTRTSLAPCGCRRSAFSPAAMWTTDGRMRVTPGGRQVSRFRRRRSTWRRASTWRVCRSIP